MSDRTDAESAGRLEQAYRAIAADTEWKIPKSHPARRRFSTQVEALSGEGRWHDMGPEERLAYSPMPPGPYPQDVSPVPGSAGQHSEEPT